MHTWERRDKKRVKGKTYKFKKNGESVKANKAQHRFRDEDITNDETFDELDELDETII